MLNAKNIDVYGFDASIRAMRNPMNSHSKSDSQGSSIGENDLKLMKKLYRSGVEHRTFARLIQVSMDITAPLYWWKEMDRYCVGKSQVSESTMHTIHKKIFTIGDFSCEYLLSQNEEKMFRIIDALNTARERYVSNHDKTSWWQMIQLLPSSYNQKRTVQMSYEVVFKILRERSSHKLDEWRILCGILRGLPYVSEITKE